MKEPEARVCGQGIAQRWRVFTVAAPGNTIERHILAAAAPMVDHPVVRDREQQGLELCRRPITRALPGHREPDILQQVVGQRRVTHMPHQITPDRQTVKPVQVIKRQHVTGHETLHRSFVAVLVMVVARHGHNYPDRPRAPARPCTSLADRPTLSWNPLDRGARSTALV